MHGFSFSCLKKIFSIVTIIIFLLVTVKVLNSVDNSRKNLVAEKWVEQTNINQIETDKEFLKIFHLDLKGGAPILNYLLKILPIIKEGGANAILIEYEDMFPFYGRLKNISAKNAYSLKEVRLIVQFAESLNMKVIPLVQTFGHLEYLLKLEEFERFRELEAFPQEICPLNKEAVEMVKEMIKQIMAVHPNSRYIHIGCDEVRHIGACSKCSRINSKKLFSKHVLKMANYIKLKYPKVTPLIWDDMLRRWTFLELDNSGLGPAVEPVVWVYGNNIFNLVPPFIWNIYQRIFPNIWIASAFKGAFGETETLPNLTLHLENNLSWMRIINKKEKELIIKPEISGIFITGWSRYDHFAVLCELLPVGIPSLILSLTFLDSELKNNRSFGFNKWLKILKCPPMYFKLYEPEEPVFQYKMGNCSFPGSDLYSAVVEYKKLKERVIKITNIIDNSGWTSVYNLNKNFTSPWRLFEMFPEEGFAGEILKKEISNWKSSFLVIMDKYFDKHTRKEWEEQNIIPLEEKMEKIQTDFQMLIERRWWPRRPLG